MYSSSCWIICQWVWVNALYTPRLLDQECKWILGCTPVLLEKRYERIMGTPTLETLCGVWGIIWGTPLDLLAGVWIHIWGPWLTWLQWPWRLGYIPALLDWGSECILDTPGLLDWGDVSPYWVHPWITWLRRCVCTTYIHGKWSVSTIWPCLPCQ